MSFIKAAEQVSSLPISCCSALQEQKAWKKLYNTYYPNVPFTINAISRSAKVKLKSVYWWGNFSHENQLARSIALLLLHEMER